MKRNDKNKNEEPFPAEHTPNPPQMMDPNRQDAGNENNNNTDANARKPEAEKEKQHLLSDDADIEDETTI
jgi:hypothetical protein